MPSKTRLIYFLSHPVQYFSPLLKALAQVVDLHVYYFSDDNLKGMKDKEFGQVVMWDIPLLEGYNYTFIKNISPTPGLANKFFNLINPGALKYLRKEPSKIIIANGWSYFSTIFTIICARLLGKSVWLRGESPLSQEIKKPTWLLFIKRILLKGILFRFVSRFLYIGKQNKMFYEYYGVHQDKLIYTPYSVDNDLFAARFDQLKDHVPALREKLNLPSDKILIVFSGKYIQKKRPLDLIKAFELLATENAALVMVGEGELRTEMEEYITRHNITDVYLTGFINQQHIPDYYTVADIFVMCSGAGETWGLSVNEAMNFENPVVVTDTCGCSSDLVHHGKNGFIVEEGNISQLADALRKLIHDDVFRRTAGQLSKQLIQDYSIDKIVESLKVSVN